MRYKAVFIVGFAAGFVAGARSGRETYDKIVAKGQAVASNPKVRQATETAQARATDLAKTAAARAPEAAKSAARTAQAQVPKYVSTAKEAAVSAKEAAASKIPGRLGGSGDAGAPDDVAADGNLVYPAEGSPSINGIQRHYNPDAP